MTRDEMLESGRTLMEEFCRINGLSVPRVDVVEKRDWRFPQTCAYYRANVITICPAACSVVGRAGWAWSYPGYVTDRTPHGVLQHELGHHVDWLMSEVKGAYGGDFSSAMRGRTGEPRLTSYCPNDWEWFAEMFRLFVTNPDLLRLLRPHTYDSLRLRFEPTELRPWREVLAGAPERTIEMAAKKVAA